MRLIALTLLIAGALLGAAGGQGLAWARTALARAAQDHQRVELVLRLNQPAKARASPWGGETSVTAVGTAWLAGAETGPGVPMVAYLEGSPPRMGSVLRLRARLEPAERASDQRVVAHALAAPEVSRPEGWRGFVYDLRVGLSERANPLLEGIALGDTSRIAPALDADLKATSLTHITAVSGAHVAIVLGLVLGLAALARLPRWLTAMTGAATLIGFVVLIGPGPSVLRAVLMGLVAVVGIAFGKTRMALGALASAVLLVLLADPWMARSYGLLLSALATAGLIVLAPPLGLALRRRWPRLPTGLAEAIALTASAQVLCAPVITIFAGQISLTAMPANLLAGPAVPVATIAALAALALGPVSSVLADVGVAVGNGAANLIGWVASWVARWPLAAIPWPSGAGGFLLALAATAALIGLAWWLRRQRAWLRLAAGVMAVVVFAAAGPARTPIERVMSRGPPADWAVAVCDVGQGTAVAVRSGSDAAVLIDAGPEGGGVGECLRSLGANRLDLVVLTHFHADHVGGLADALAGREVGELAYGPPCGQDPSRTLSLAQKAGADLRQLSDSGRASATVGSATVSIYPSPLAELCPEAPSSGEDQAANDAGLAVLAESAGLTVWALGDLEEAGQSALLRTLRATEADPSVGADAPRGADSSVTVGRSVSADWSGRADLALAAEAAPAVAADPPPGTGASIALGRSVSVGRSGRADLAASGGPAARSDGGNASGKAAVSGAGGVVVVAHHGSASQSESLAEALVPRLSVMSAGRDNSYGHPSPAALELYGKFGVVKRTDQDGLVALQPGDLVNSN
ncbi:MAG: ComEC/Rec2 family competence protein [Bifidobacteriaceae bacterium]|nr:ComEC/Rec2 family competence protein [Bifidobacteriaceae bacterium]